MNGYRYLENVVSLTLDPAACIGCGRCVEVCPHHVFILNDGKAVMADRDLCMECGACSRNCPADAIAVDAGVGCAIGIFNDWLHARKAPKRGCP